jgi:hypothetical protein
VSFAAREAALCVFWFGVLAFRYCSSPPAILPVTDGCLQVAAGYFVWRLLSRPAPTRKTSGQQAATDSPPTRRGHLGPHLRARRMKDASIFSLHVHG